MRILLTIAWVVVAAVGPIHAQTKELRFPLRDTRVPPHCYVGKLVTSGKRTIQVNKVAVVKEFFKEGSGVLIGPKHVLTAAHLLFHEDGTLYENMDFMPGYSFVDLDGVSPFNVYSIVDIGLQRPFEKVFTLNKQVEASNDDLPRDMWRLQKTLDLAVLTLNREVRPAHKGMAKPDPSYAGYAAYPDGLARPPALQINGYDKAAKMNQASRDATITVIRDKKFSVTYPGKLIGDTSFTTPLTIFETGVWGSDGVSGGPLWKKVVKNEAEKKYEMTVVGIVLGPNYANRKQQAGPSLSGVLLDVDYCKWINGFGAPAAVKLE